MARFMIFMVAIIVGHQLLNPAAAQEDPCGMLLDSVYPCICESGILDCSPITGGDELLTIPGLHSGQSLAFYVIRIANNDYIQEIPDGAFGNHYARYEYNFRQNPHLRSIGKSVLFAPNETATANIVVADSNPSLQSFPFEDLTKLTSLETVVLDHTGLTTIPPSAFEGLPNVKTILLYSSQIRSIGSNAFANTPKLQSLILDSNRLTSLTADWFNFASPVYVVLAGNSISEVRGNFSNFASRTILYGNLLETLPEEVWEPIFGGFEESDADESIEFGENPFVCDCRLKWLYDNQTFKKYTETIVCTNVVNGPPNFWELEDSFFADC